MTPDARSTSPSYRWVAVLVLGLAVLLVIAWFTIRGLRPRGAGAGPPGEPAEAIDTDRYLGPIEADAVPGTAEKVAPFSGFAVSVETDPEDALVTIAGVERGESPVLAGIQCEPGAAVPIRVVKPGFRPARASTVCRSDALVKLTVRLPR